MHELQLELKNKKIRLEIVDIYPKNSIESKPQQKTVSILVHFSSHGLIHVVMVVVMVVVVVVVIVVVVVVVVVVVFVVDVVVVVVVVVVAVLNVDVVAQLF